MFNLKEYSLFNNGGLAVNFFFVLSGFLISFLLLREIKQTNKISVKKFYIRRILRIWPLYFLLVALGTLLIPLFLQLIEYPYEFPYQFDDVVGYYVFFAPFMVNAIFGHHLLEPLWSIGVEEIFYIVWAPLFKFLKNNILTIILSVIFIKTALLYFLPLLNLSSQALEVIDMLYFEAMAIGGLAAYLVYHRKKSIDSAWLFSKGMQLTIFGYILLRISAFDLFSEQFLFFAILFKTPVLSKLLLTFSFAWLIVNISLNQKSLINLNHKWMNYLGDISYGIYMYHMLVIFAIILFAKSFMIDLPDWAATSIFYFLITFFVIVVSHYSKQFFENYFLNLKGKFRAVFS